MRWLPRWKSSDPDSARLSCHTDHGKRLPETIPPVSFKLKRPQNRIPAAPGTSTLWLLAGVAYHRSRSGLIVLSLPATKILLGLLVYAGGIMFPCCIDRPFRAPQALHLEKSDCPCGHNQGTDCRTLRSRKPSEIEWRSERLSLSCGKLHWTLKHEIPSKY
jgi:hypothetical protein